MKKSEKIIFLQEFIPNEARNMYYRARNLQEYTFLRELGTYIPMEYFPERGYMEGNKFPGTFTPALSQELFSPEPNSGIIIPSYQREYESWLRKYS